MKENSNNFSQFSQVLLQISDIILLQLRAS